MLRTLEEKTEAMREVFKFLKEFHEAPKETDAGALDYWKRCNDRMQEIALKYNNDPFVTKLLIVVWENFESTSHLRTVMDK